MKTAETKYASSYAALSTPNTYSPFNSVIAGDTQWSSCLPSIIAGVDDYDRIGTLIQPISNKVYLDVRLKASTFAYPHDITIVVYYGVCKKYKKFEDLSLNSAQLCSELLRCGGVSGVSSADTQEFGGILSDSHLPINNATWKLKKATARLYKAPGVTNGSTGAGVLSTPNQTNHTFVLDFTSFLPSKLKYVEATDDEPENYAPVWGMGYYYNDGTAPDVDSGSGICEFRSNAMLLYKDI